MMMSQATLTAVVWKEESGYVSTCPELGVASCGDSADDAVTMLKEAVSLYLENAKMLGILDSLAPVVQSNERFTTSLEVPIP